MYQKKSDIDSSSNKQKCSPLDKINVTAAGYFKEKRSPKKSEELQDHDMDFLKSLLPDIKSLDAHNRRKLKISIMKLVDDACKEASYSQNTNVHNIHDTLSYSRQPSQDQQSLSNFQKANYIMSNHHSYFHILNHLHLMKNNHQPNKDLHTISMKSTQ